MKQTEPNAVHKALNAQTSPPHVRRTKAILFISALSILMVAFTLLSLLVRRADFFPIDLQVTQFLQQMNSPIANDVMLGISWVGYTPQSFILVVLAAALIYFLGFRWESVVCLLSAVTEELLNLLIKVVIHRPRPSMDLVHVYKMLGSYSFPSGHVMFYTCFFGFFWFIIFTLLKHSWKRTLLLVIVGSQIMLISVSRIYLGEHWASDTVGAYLLGGLALLIIIQFYRWGKSRFFTRQPVARGRK